VVSGGQTSRASRRFEILPLMKMDEAMISVLTLNQNPRDTDPVSVYPMGKSVHSKTFCHDSG